MTDQSLDGPLLGPAEIRELAERAGIRPTKTLGQNFVIDPNTIRRIVATAHLTSDEHVLEVGPGLGSLTLGLLAESSAVTAVEIDPPLAAQAQFSFSLEVLGQLAQSGKATDEYVFVLQFHWSACSWFSQS